ncbi:uncharacterized protein LOC131958585 isoform X2 [Physella acuta]|uniref:uncharacterized protein LOC131958585 isoform X2 n=1 Tax=Physella acuta TaxID=109671 RepID=UPI0027DE027F|nr:uncharacterized protein LOC131958585 isoform X2 [Physella acuta]
MGKPENNGKQKETSMVLDLSEFVAEVDRFSRLIEPFALIFYFIDDIRRWRFRQSTILIWIVCNVACFWLTQGAVFVLASTFVIGVATLSLFQVHTQILNKILPSNQKVSKLQDGEEEVAGALDTVQNFRYSLIEMHDFVVKSNEYLSYFYSILKWDSVGPSAIYHIEACIFLLSLVICPARWNCFLFINWFFLCHPHKIKKCFTCLTEYLSSKKQVVDQSEKVSAEGSEKEQISGEKCEKDHCEEDQSGEDSSDQELTEEASDNSLVNLDPAPAKPGMVARLMEIKKRRKQIANAPAAMKETVLVCCSCHALLVSQSEATAESTEKHGPG